jgi:hypothetical protein
MNTGSVLNQSCRYRWAAQVAIDDIEARRTGKSSQRRDENDMGRLARTELKD